MVTENPSTVSQPGEPKPPLTKREMCAWLKVSKRKLEKDMAGGLIPYFKLGGRVCFDLTVVSESFRQRCKAGGGR